MMIEAAKICPICDSEKTELQPPVTSGRQDVFYECGNSVSYEVFDNPEDIVDNNNTCKYKVDWDVVLVERAGEFDDSAKLVDDRFFGWIELNFYKDAHQANWHNKYQGKSCTEKQFLDQYFSNKEIYIGKVREINEMNFYAQPITETVVKSYDDWIGEVTMQKVYDKLHEKHGTEEQKIVYKVISAENENLEGGYVIEINPVGGGDKIRDFYSRDILDIIIEKETQ